MAASGVVGPTSGPVIRGNDGLLQCLPQARTRGAPGRLGQQSLLAHRSVHTAWASGSQATLPPPKQVAVHQHATVTPNTGLNDGQAVTVRWSGLHAKTKSSISSSVPTWISARPAPASCSFAHAAILHPDPTGSGSGCPSMLALVPSATESATSAHSCYVIVNNANSANPADTKALPIRFASWQSGPGG